MKRLTVSLVCVLMPWLMLAAREISGRVTDSDSVAIEFANVAAFARDSVVGGGMTDVSGSFRIMVAVRCDSVRVSYVGYEDVVISPVPENGLGHIYELTARDKIGLQLDYNPDWSLQYIRLPSQIKIIFVDGSRYSER